jgi:hypothetical protein
MRVLKNSRPFINAIFLIVFTGTLLNAQEKPTETAFPINFSCGQVKITDLQGNMNGWLVVSDITSKDDGLQVKTQHAQRMYRPEDYKKIDNYCLQVHKEFNAEREKERKRLQKQSRKPKNEILTSPQKDEELKSSPQNNEELKSAVL